MALFNADRIKALEHENQRLRRSVEELSLLNDLAREIGASLDPDEIMHRIVRRALKAVQAEQGLITLVGEGTDDLMRTLIRTADSAIDTDPHHLNDNLLGWMHLHKQPLLINDPFNDKRFQGIRWDRSLHSILCTPLLIRSRLIGILTVFNKHSPDGFTDDDQRLLSIIAAQSAQIVENARLHREEQALVLMREELRLAKEIQTTLLPVASPEVPGYQIAGVSYPAQSVGGDYFDYLPLDGHLLGLCVADVSGKGLPASLLMANVQATLHGQAPVSDGPAACIGRVNTLLYTRLRRGTFVTLVYGVLDPATHQFRYANAGHNRPLHCTADGTITRLDTGGLALGFRSSFTYEEAVHPLAPGDVLLLYSDGLTEAMNLERVQFGETRLADLLAAHAGKPPSVLIERLVNAVQQHTGPAPALDDITLMVVKRDQ